MEQAKTPLINEINLSEGTIDNFYSEFSIKCEDTLLNIMDNKPLSA